MTQVAPTLAEEPSQVGVQSALSEGFSLATNEVAACISNPCRVRIKNLRPGTAYKFWVTSLRGENSQATAIHESHLTSPFPEDVEAQSAEAVVTTKETPGTKLSLSVRFSQGLCVKRSQRSRARRR